MLRSWLSKLQRLPREQPLTPRQLLQPQKLLGSSLVKLLKQQPLMRVQRLTLRLRQPVLQMMLQLPLRSPRMMHQYRLVMH
jgi:hypothetical protein